MQKHSDTTEAKGGTRAQKVRRADDPVHIDVQRQAGSPQARVGAGRKTDAHADCDHDNYFCCLRTAFAAAKRAIGTRNGEQET